MNSRHRLNFTGKGFVSLCAALVASGILFLPGKSAAVLPSSIVTLIDGGSSATVDLNSSAGMYNWSVNGQNQLNQQWFWYAIGSTAPQPINSIGLVNSFTTGGNEVTALYQNAQLTLTIDYVLSGGGAGSGSADITESISAVNNSGGSVDLHFYQYSDFNLLGNGANDTVKLFGNAGGPWNFVQQTADGSGIGEAVVAPSANHGEAAVVGTTLSELNGAVPLTLDDNANAGPDDVTWALEWDTPLSQQGTSGDTFDLTKDKSLFVQVIPEPSTVALIALGISAWGLARRRPSC